MTEHAGLPPMRCLPWPVPEPPLKLKDFHDEVDWFAIPHEELYEMATNGLDLASAGEVAGQWTRLGAELDQIGQELRGALDLSDEAWQGEGAEEARTAMRRLLDWTHQTSESSGRVSDCVTEQAELAASASKEMPEPLPSFRPTPVPRPDAPFAEASRVIDDPMQERDRAAAVHRQAAEVMHRYQEQARAVYTRVPAFVDPDLDSDSSNRTTILEDPDGTGRKEPDDTTTASSVTPAGGGTGMGPTGAPQPGAPTPAPPGPGGHTGAVGGSPGAGPTTGVLAGQGATPAAGASAPGASGGAVRAGGMGAMPMGGAGARRQEDTEHRRPSYLEETDDVWSDGTAVTPPVIGERPGGGFG